MQWPLVVIIATANRQDLLRRTLASLGECERPAGYRETIVIENGSKNGAEEIVRAAPSWLRARYLFEPMGNKSAALNRGLHGLDECLIFFTDDDARFHPRTLAAYADASAGRQGGEFYGGPIAVDYEKEPPEWLKPYLPPSARGWKPEGEVKSILKPDFLGINWASFARDLRAAGGFDTNRGPGSPTASVGQEKEMQVRLLKNGIAANYVRDALVWHYVPKQRCSIYWTLTRAYRNGVQEGMDQTKTRDKLSAPTLFGYPRWMIRQWLTESLVVLKTIVSGDRSARFMAVYQWQFLSGYLRGVRFVLRAKNQPAG